MEVGNWVCKLNVWVCCLKFIYIEIKRDGESYRLTVYVTLRQLDVVEYILSLTRPQTSGTAR